MKMKVQTFHHTHWDAEWYFTEQESQVQFVYHMKELLNALDHNWIKYYHLDGKSCHLDDYFKYCPQDEVKFTKYVKEGRVFIGPLYEQLSCFIAPGESIIKNLRLGMDRADELGGTSNIAYIPDSFGQTQDYPKIFNGVGIKDFVFRRGMGDQHHLKNDFIWKSNDGSQILTNVLQAGYSFAGLAFMQGRLIKNAGLNLDKKSIINQMKLLGEQSTLDHEFLLPAGKDNCPVMFEFNNLIKQYNEESEDFTFDEITLEQYMDKLRNAQSKLQEYEGEFYATQYHRVHKSIFSARPDIKSVQDKLERLLIYEVQPLLCIGEQVGIVYEHGLVDDIWKILIRSQTHSEATNSDEVNEQILSRALNALKYAESIKVYITRKIVSSFRSEEGVLPMVVFNTSPHKKDINDNYVIYSKSKEFQIKNETDEIPYSILKQKKVYGGWRRKHRELLDSGRDYYETTISMNLKSVDAMSYTILSIYDGVKSSNCAIANNNETYIENNQIKVELFHGQLSIRNKKTKEFIENAIYFEDSGDQGDTFDYDYPTEDFFIHTSFENARVTSSYETNEQAQMTISGELKTCKDLDSRRNHCIDNMIPYTITIAIKHDDNMIHVMGKVTNNAYNHRVRLVVKSNIVSETSLAGTQFGYIERDVCPKEIQDWKKDHWLEEPLPIEPLLNYVAIKDHKKTQAIFTRSCKEYEILKQDTCSFAITLFRSIGHFGLPDLNRRPGRASGIPEEIMEAPRSQMIDKEIEFDIGIQLYDEFDANIIGNDYINFARTPVYFQKQEFNRIFVSMKYFEVNALPYEIPQQISMFELKDSAACISSIEKSKEDNAYVIRIFNNENKSIHGGHIATNLDIKKVELVDFRENRIAETNLNIEDLKTGEIRTYKLYV